MTDAQDAHDPIHLAVIGGGLAGCAATSWAASQGARVTLFNAGLPLGGSSIHTDQLPARILMHAATATHRARHPHLPGLGTTELPVDLAALQSHRHDCGHDVQALLRQRLQRHDGVHIVEAQATFVDDLTLRADGQLYHPDRVLLTPGSRSQWPDIDGLQDIDPWSLADLASLQSIPDSLIFVETSHSALAYAQALCRLGTDVTILSHRDSLLGPRFDPDVDQALHDLLRHEGVAFLDRSQVTHAERRQGAIRLLGTRDGQPQRWDASHVVFINHRTPRIQDLDLSRAHIDTDDGFITIDESLTTTNPHVVAAGDAVGRHHHPYAAAYDAIQAAHNAISASRTAGQSTAIPFTIDTDPPVAGVGLHEARARQLGFDAQIAALSLDTLPAAQAMGHSRGFIKLVRDARSHRLLGARLMMPGAHDLIMELVLAIRYGLTSQDLAALIHPPVSMAEGLSRAARQFDDQHRPDSTDFTSFSHAQH